MLRRLALAASVLLLPLAAPAQIDERAGGERGGGADGRPKGRPAANDGQEELEREIEDMIRAQSEPAKPAELEATAKKILRDMAVVRELEVKRPVAMEVATRAQIVAYVDSRIKEEMKEEELRGQELALKRLGLIPTNMDMRKFLLDLYGEQVAGYYDPFKQKFYISSWMDTQQQTPIMAHELTHALQDQHFNLKPFLTPIPHNSDATSARQAVVEGDAVISMLQYLMGRVPPGPGAMLRGAMAGPTYPVFAGAPPYFQEALFFPYADGADFVAEIRGAGGFKPVTAIYKDLPRSTEQVLHPEKYSTKRDDPTPVELPMAMSGYVEVHSDVLGELVFRVMLAGFLDEDRAAAAAEGWDGDRYRAFQKKGAKGLKETFVTIRTVWDTAEDAKEFFGAYSSMVPEKYDGATKKKIATTKDADQTARFATVEDGLVHLELRGTQVLVIDGAPDEETVTLARKAAWDGKGT